MSNVDWSKAPEGATHYCDGCWYKMMGGKWYYCFEVARLWKETTYANPANFSWWGHRVERPAAPQWNGEGLPPVGALVEALYMGSPQGVVTVRYAGQCMILWSEDRQSEQCGAAEHYLFLPIRTPEQLAAEAREKAVAAMVAIMCKDGAFDADDPECTFAMEKLHDAGYRKVDAVAS